MSRATVNMFNTTDLDRVLERLKVYYSQGEQDNILLEHEREFVEAIELAHALMVENRCNREVARHGLQAQFTFLSNSSAYRIVDFACLLKATETVSQHKYHKFWLSEYLKKEMEAASIRKDTKGFAALSAQFMALHKLDEEVEEKNNWADMMQGIVIEFGTDKTLLPQQYTEEEEAEIFMTIDTLKEKARKQKHGIR
jgi:coproporphyrinogen III oxidase-like Fe-S oxidoreductase